MQRKPPRMELKEPYESLRRYDHAKSKVAPYIVIALLIIALPIFIYDYFNLFRFHTDRAVLFCVGGAEKTIRVMHEQNIEDLKLFYDDPLEFEKLSEKRKQQFSTSIFELDPCQDGYLYSANTKGARKMKFISQYTNGNTTVYVLDRFVEEIPK